MTERGMPRRAASKLRRQWRRHRVEQIRRSYARRPTNSVAAGDVDRLVPSPAFVLSSIRSGSTLLRSVLDAHPQITAPHEMHLGELRFEPSRSTAAQAYRELGLDQEEMLNLLWDRVLHRQLLRTNTTVIVDKTPRNTFAWPRIQRAWPDAKFIILLRHPFQILRSMQNARPGVSESSHIDLVNSYVETLDEARNAVPAALVVKYEELTAEPERETRRLCEYLGVPWDAGMLDYGRAGVRYRRGLGDWSANIRTGKIQPSAPLPALDDVPPRLRDAAVLLGY